MYQIIKTTPALGSRVIHKDIESYGLAAFMVKSFVKAYKDDSEHGMKGRNEYRRGRAVCYEGGDLHEFRIEKM